MTDPIQPISDSDLLMFRLRVESRHDCEDVSFTSYILQCVLARLTAAEAERDETKAAALVVIDRHGRCATAAIAERDAAVARAERLREALRTIEGGYVRSADPDADATITRLAGMIGELQDVARQALAIDDTKPHRPPDNRHSGPAETLNRHEEC